MLAARWSTSLELVVEIPVDVDAARAVLLRIRMRTDDASELLGEIVVGLGV